MTRRIVYTIHAPARDVHAPARGCVSDRGGVNFFLASLGNPNHVEEVAIGVGDVGSHADARRTRKGCQVDGI